MATQEVTPTHVEVCHRCDRAPVMGDGILCDECSTIENDTVRAAMRRYR